MAWPVFPHGFLGSQGGDSDTYRIERSLRFNSADSAYLTRTPASAGNRKTWTWSGWVKRSDIGSSSRGLFITNTTVETNGSTYFLFLGGTNSLYFATYESGVTKIWETTQVFRDPSAWYHVLLVFDTTQASATNRVKIYINGVQVTSFSTQNTISQYYDSSVNDTVVHEIANLRNSLGTRGSFFDGYLAEINFIDGQALTPSSFGETDAITGRWKAKAYGGTYGTNGFYLNFSDNSSLTTTSNVGIGKDFSGNANYWATNGISINAGAGNDSLVDSPTNYGSDSGLGGEVRGNYCTLNPLQLTNSATAPNNGNLTSPANSGAWRRIGCTIQLPTTGKWYFEYNCDSFSSFATFSIGVFSGSIDTGNNNQGYLSTEWAYDGQNGYAINNNISISSGFTTATTGDVLQLAYDADTGKIWFGKNNTWQGASSPNPATGTSATYSGVYNVTPLIIQNWAVQSVNFGQRPFAYTAPTGFKALCTQNLTQPTIQKPSTAMDVVLYTGNQTARNITGLGFSPDFVWIKNRFNAGGYHHQQFDSVRGATKVLRSSTTGSEYVDLVGLTSFNSDGFSLGTNADETNKTGDSYVAWSWDAGSTTSTNTSGSITSTVRANPQAGFSIVSYTGTGNTSSGETIGHGLGATPAMFITKMRNATGTDYGWSTWHKSLSSTNGIWLDKTNGQNSSMISANPVTSTTFKPFDKDYNNVLNATYINYVFAEIEGYSKFGSYTGTGTTDGAFVWCGFRPRWVMIKRSDATSNWELFDTAREPNNVMIKELYPNLADVENASSSDEFDIISNGFKPRSTNTIHNASGGTYIFAAFAEAPFKYARAR